MLACSVSTLVRCPEGRENRRTGYSIKNVSGTLIRRPEDRVCIGRIWKRLSAKHQVFAFLSRGSDIRPHPARRREGLIHITEVAALDFVSERSASSAPN